MNKLKYLLILLALLPATLRAQEIHTCNQTGKEYLFLGRLSVEGQKGKFIENSNICWKEMDSLQQTDFLSTKTFLDTIFSQNLRFEMEGYEPFWKARLTKDMLIFFDPETGKETAYPVRIVPNTSTMDNHIYFMFEGQQGHVFGLVDYAGLRDLTGQEYCEYNLEEDEKALYSVFLTVGNKTYKGCAGIELGGIVPNSPDPPAKRLSFKNIAEITADGSYSTWAEVEDGKASLALRFDDDGVVLACYSSECYLTFPYKVEENKIVVYWDVDIDTKYDFDIVKAVNRTDKKYIGQPFMILELANDTTFKAIYPLPELIRKINNSSTEKPRRIFFPDKYVIIQQGYL